MLIRASRGWRRRIVDEDLERSQAEVNRLRRENQRLRQMLGLGPGDPLPGGREPRPSATALPLDQPTQAVDARSTEAVRVALFRSLFRGRDDVYAVRWTNRHGEYGYVPAVAGGWRKDRPRRQRRNLALTDDVVRAHLAGDETIGLYPLLEDDHCWVLVADFDGPTWCLDALAYLDAAA